jgi:DNA polymerase III alpha subunit (gram-positive type)
MTTTFVTVDVETTGLDPYKDAMIEIAAVIFQSNGKILDEWSSLLNPNQEIPAMITRLTGITQEMVDGAPSIYSQRF